MFGTLGGPELFLIFVVALIVFGPRKLPEIGKSLGKMMGEFRRASNDFRSTIESEVEAEKIRDSLRIEPPRVEPVAPARALPEAGAGSAEPPAEAQAASEAPAPSVEPVAEAVSREAVSEAPESR
jgi:Tat protein translocase TatB subunit